MDQNKFSMAVRKAIFDTPNEHLISRDILLNNITTELEKVGILQVPTPDQPETVTLESALQAIEHVSIHNGPRRETEAKRLLVAPFGSGIDREKQEDLINLLQALRPQFGAVGSRDVDVRNRQEQIDSAIALLYGKEPTIAASNGSSTDAKSSGEVSEGLDPRDLRIDTFIPGGCGGFIAKPASGVRITHLPTGITAEHSGDRSAHRNKTIALQKLTEMVALLESKYNGEIWEPLAMALASEEHDDIHQIIYTSDPMPEPWGEVWQRYEDDAKRMIDLVARHVLNVVPAVGQQGDSFLHRITQRQNVLAHTIEDARRYEYRLQCEVQSAKEYLPDLDPVAFKKVRRAKDDEGIAQASGAQ